MKLVRLTHPHTLVGCPPTCMALGFFDGVHRGHQAVIEAAVQYANTHQLTSAVMTFDPHPSVVLGRGVQHVQMITPLERKVQQIEQLGVDTLYVVEFTTAFADLLPQQFVDQYIIGLNVKHVVAGFDFSYGRLGKGTMETLPFHAREQFTATTVHKLEHEAEKVSSTRIRELLANGEVDGVEALLGRTYTTSGVVVDGEKRGRTIGFPTANIELNADYIVPKPGVYAVKAVVNGVKYGAVCNVGYKPTFHKEQLKLSIEVHIFEFNASIYGDTVTIEWHKRIRDEKKFNGIDALIAQIHADKLASIDYFTTK